jgi:UDP-N-acetyl-D-glucosamine dehydrogenase
VTSLGALGSRLEERLKSRSATVGVVGLGYVGLPLAVAFARAGFQVIGVDADPARTALLAGGLSPVEDVPAAELAPLVKSGRLAIHSAPGALGEADAIVICVPTPLGKSKEPDISFIVAAADGVARVLRPGTLVVLESTTYPGTTRERLVPMLEESGLAADRDFFVAFSPERVDPGRTDHTLRTTPKVVGALTPESLQKAVELYELVCDNIVTVSTPEAAELTKLLENVFRSVNIALVNELAILCDRMGVDIWEVVDAAATKPYGFMSFKPGPGMGGHCLPVDPFYLAWRAREFDQPTEFIELAGEVNQRMPYFCVEKIGRALNDHSRPINGSRIAVVGVSYKAGVGDVRESPGLKIIRLLRHQGGDVVYNDDFVPELADFGLASQPLDLVLDGADCVVIVTAHPGLDVERIVASAPLVVDFRGVTRGIEASNLVRL